MNKQTRDRIVLFLGPILFISSHFFDKPDTMSHEAYSVLGITLWMATWWIFEAVPIAVTALLPIVLFPMTGALDIASTTASFGHKYIFLYMGGFILAIAIEKWGLHRRMALYIINLIGTNIQKIILGFMVATGFLSMWISNTATSVMMLPIGMAIVSQFKRNTEEGGLEGDKFGKALMLSIAYSASIGGFATLIGTPPNLVFAGILEELYHVKLTFFQWLKFGLPVSIVLILICWRYMTKYAFKFDNHQFPGGASEIKRMLTGLGKMSYEEKSVLIVFILTAIAWISRSLLEGLMPMLDDSIIAMTAGIVLFTLPAKNENRRLITWEEALKLPWGIILLFGGGMALAKGFTTTGLAEWIAVQMTELQGLSMIVLILVVVAIVNFMTEITSNLATTAMLLPVLAPMALAFDIHPYMIMTSVTLAASCAFMLPVATPPNAVVFGSGYLRIQDMVRSGVVMNIISIILITAFTYFLLPYLWGFDPNSYPKSFRVFLN